MTTAAQSIESLPSITATQTAAPPAWALLERKLFEVMEHAAALKVAKFSDRAGVPFYADDLDDYYEMVYNWGLFYSMGADSNVLDLALRHWNAVTRFGDDSIVSWHRNNEEGKGKFTPSVNEEYYGPKHPGDAEWHHKGEGNMAFYHLMMADPTISENVRRLKRFASFYTGENPAAPNYDPRYRILRSPFQTPKGPWHKANYQQAATYLMGGLEPGARGVWYGRRSSLYPVVKDLGVDWWKSPARQAEIVGLFDKIVLQSDSSNNLGATALLTAAYMATGEDRYRQWVLDYIEAWMDRMKKNGGIMPDNVGPTGKIGEHREGVWWGGIYGWNSYCGFNIMFHSFTIASECGLLLTGDKSYLDILRSQVQLLIANGKVRERDGQFLIAVRHGPNGWGHSMWHPVNGHDQQVRVNEITRLFNASMSDEDRSLVRWARDHDKERDWSKIEPYVADFEGGPAEMARFQYYEGKLPEWPERTLQAELDGAVKTYREMVADERSVEQILADNRVPSNPVRTKVLTHVMHGAPQSVYHGGLDRALVRYFDADRMRPGIPPDVAALVDEIGPDRVGVQLVNTSRSAARSLIIQAGAFGEHSFTDVRTDSGEAAGSPLPPRGRDTERGSSPPTPVNGKYLRVTMPPSTGIRLSLGMKRFVNQPSYRFPWHGEKIPVPFQ
ncbi:MAG: hypothetical protein FJ319_09980 [SAR202 cluster bacterium]|nr:hypothetical protein [SAR202 cluster bacterium]